MLSNCNHQFAWSPGFDLACGWVRKGLIDMQALGEQEPMPMDFAITKPGQAFAMS